MDTDQKSGSPQRLSSRQGAADRAGSARPVMEILFLTTVLPERRTTGGEIGSHAFAILAHVSILLVTSIGGAVAFIRLGWGGRPEDPLA